MLELARAHQGFSIIEMLVAVALVSILLMFGVPSIGTWVHNGQIRTAAETIQTGLQMARAEAVRRNFLVRFQLTSTADSTCVISGAGTSWVISLDDPTGLCDSPPMDNIVATDLAVAPRIIQTRSGTEGTTNVVVATAQPTFVFNGFGRLAPAPAGRINIDVSNPTGGACAPGGPMRCLRIVVESGGQTRMCDPLFAAPDPQGC